MFNKFFRHLLVAACALAVLGIIGSIQAPPAQAAAIMVTTLADNANSGDKQCTLREAINNANAGGDTTNHDCAAGSGNDTIGFRVSGTITLGSALPTLKTNLTITDTGSSVTLDGAGQYPILRVNGSSNTVTLNGLVLQNASCDSNKGGGGALTNFDNVNIKGATFKNNDASDCLGGGAINNEGGSLNITTSYFVNNSAGDGGGGAILNSGNITLTTDTFTNNSGEDGGAIYNFPGSNLSVSNTLFKSNDDASYGAAIYNDAATLNVDRSTFNKNATDGEGYGGGLANRNGTATITNSTFSNGYAKRGGGIYNEGGNLNVIASTLVNNEGWGGGGGMYNTNGSVNGHKSDGITIVTNSTLVQNWTDGEFGGAFFTDGTDLFLVNDTMAHNDCTDCGFGAAAIYGEDNSNISIKNTIIAPFATAPNCDVDTTHFFADGTNFDTDGSCGSATTVTKEQLNLGPLKNNGGPTQTLKPLGHSVAIDAGDDLICTSSIGAPNYGAGAVDQRGITRPVGVHCDVGSYEVRLKTQ